MQYHISEKMSALKPSAIREIFKYSADPTVISLAAGSPAPEGLPVDTIRRLMAEILEEDAMTALQYSQSEGYPALRQALKEYMGKKHGVVGEDDELIVLSGAQQCMDLACKVLCNEGDVVICEDPSFIGSLNTFRSYNVDLVGVPVQDDGVDVAALEKALEQNPNARFMYLIPNFQNPTGITMSLEKRRAVYALAKKYAVPILEDNPYGDLRFAGEHIPAIKSMDTEGLVMYAGTFSKILSPGIRVGYLIAPQGPMSKLVVAKQCTDVHTGMLSQMLCHRFLTTCDIDGHIEGLKSIYSHKCGVMLDALERHMPANTSWTKPQGGLFIWCTLPEGVDSGEFATRLVKEKKVCVVPGTAFCAQQDAPSRTIRLNFTTPSDGNIETGVSAVAALLREYNQSI